MRPLTQYFGRGEEEERRCHACEIVLTGGGKLGHSCLDVLPVRGNETGEGHNPAVRKELRNLSDAADVLHAVFLGEAHVLVEPHADIVSVETVLFTPNRQGIRIGNTRGERGEGH
jgi:hypothetical protein